MNLYGASGHCKVIIDIVEALGKKVECVFDDDVTILSVLHTPVIQWINDNQIENRDLLISIGNNKIRKKISESIAANFISLTHPASIVSKYAKIGKGTAVMAGATINTGAIIGKHCIVNTNAVIEHDCVLDDFVHISPNATITGAVLIGEGTHIGAGATILPNINVGKWVTIGAGAVILKDVTDYAIVVGNPGKIIDYNEK
jgi:sugar O-acyltransferase (sialic acid O-acetyltransferase NeuD family)